MTPNRQSRAAPRVMHAGPGNFRSAPPMYQAFVLLGVVFGVAVSRFTAAAGVTAVVGSVATVVGTIVGAFFGVQAGSSGKEAAEAGRALAESTARKALAKLDPREAADLMGGL
jgi:hypothetical protein